MRLYRYFELISDTCSELISDACRQLISDTCRELISDTYLEVICSLVIKAKMLETNAKAKNLLFKAKVKSKDLQN